MRVDLKKYQGKFRNKKPLVAFLTAKKKRKRAVGVMALTHEKGDRLWQLPMVSRLLKGRLVYELQNAIAKKMTFVMLKNHVDGYFINAGAIPEDFCFKEILSTIGDFDERRMGDKLKEMQGNGKTALQFTTSKAGTVKRISLDYSSTTKVINAAVKWYETQGLDEGAALKPSAKIRQPKNIRELFTGIIH